MIRRPKNNLSFLLKIILLLLLRGLRVCSCVIMKSCNISRLAILNIFIWARTKKQLLAILVIIVVFLILWTGKLKVFHSTHDPWFADPQFSEPSRAMQSCMNLELSPLQKFIASYDVFLNRVPTIPSEDFLFPYVGNGHLAFEVEMDAQVYINREQTLSQAIPYLPVVGISHQEFLDSRTVTMDILNGLVQHRQCYEVGDLCISARSTSYAHRRRPSLLVQEINFINPTASSVAFDLDWKGFQTWPSANVTTFRLSSQRDVNVSLGSTVVTSTGSQKSFAVVVMAVALPSKVQVVAGSKKDLLSVASVQYAELKSSDHAAALFEKLRFKATEDIKFATSWKLKSLKEEHSSAWLSLWGSGFRISDSLASGVVNGPRINKTMYYLLSNARSPLMEVEVTERSRRVTEEHLYNTGSCYGGHHTLQNMRMWSEVLSVRDVIDAARIWFITLEKHGCGKMIRAGAEGILQAMMLSYGALRFSHSHLEFCTLPSDLHRDLYFRRINYGGDTHVNISVRVGVDNKAALYVSLDRNNLTFYACDAGCLDPPVRLSKSEISLPVKLTKPVTPILYITSDLVHMEELRHVIHVQSVDEAPAHEHQVMVMHKHGHKWGGLPMFFWVTISTLIVVFHLFLFKLVYNEYCSVQEHKADRHCRSKYTPNRYV